MRWIIAVAAATLINSAGCNSGAPRDAGGGLLDAARPADVFAQERYFTLLDGEMQGDQFFTRSARSHGDAFAGRYGFVVDQTLDVPLGNLWPGSDVPGIWHLLAWHVRPSVDGPVSLTLLRDGIPISSATTRLKAGQWQAIAVDLQPLRDAGIQQSRGLLLRLSASGIADELILVDNDRDLHTGAWTVRQRGLVRTAGEVQLLGVEPILEINDLRLRTAGKTVYRNGQQFDAQVQLPTPGRVSGPNVRVVRTSATDIDGDGFDEVRGAFVIAASESRAAMMFEPTRPIIDPAFEFRGLPEGEVVVTFAGALSANVERLEDGTVLVVLPGTFEQSTPIQIHVR